MKVLSEKELREKLAEVGRFSTEQAEEKQKPAQAPADNTKADLKKYCLGLLSRREYAQQELFQKAQSKGFDAQVIDAVLSYLKQENYQSDSRYCEMLIRSRIGKLSGVFRIRMELKQKGIPDSLIEQSLEQVDCDWYALAKEAAEKKSASFKNKDTKNKAKLLRFLQGRGFDGEQSRYALESLGF